MLPGGLHHRRFRCRITLGWTCQKTTAICVVYEQGRRLWRGGCATDPGAISARISKYAGVDAKVGIDTGSMTPWLVHGLRGAGLNVQCLDARRVKAALQMQLNNNDENDAEGLWPRSCARPMLGFQGFWTAKRTLAGVKEMAMLAKGQVRAVPRGNMPAQRAFVQQIFGLAA